MGNSRNEPAYGIGAVARRLGATPAALRAWEDRYGVVIPARSAGGQRRYSQEQVDQLRYLHDLVGTGVQPAEAHRLLTLHFRARGTTHIQARGTTGAPSAEERSEFVSILLAERDLRSAHLMVDVLEADGYEVVMAPGDTDVVAAYEQQCPDLVFVELVTAAGSGLELCHRLKAAGARVVAMSALDLGAAALEAGAAAFLGKPLEAREVRSTVETLLSRRSASGT